MKRKYIVLLHLAVWLVLIINDVVPLYRDNTFSSYQGLPKDLRLFAKYSFISIGFYSISALCFYGAYLVVAPALFIQKKYSKTVLLTVLLFTGLVSWRYIVEFWFFKPVLGFDNYRGNPVSVSYYLRNVFWYYFPGYFIYGLLYFFAKSFIANRNRQEALQREKLAAELAFLRSQINPHFLFNTINDIYALTYQKSDQAPGALLKLSELLRYMLREGAEDFVALENEINYLNNLVELQRIGAKGNAYIQFVPEGYVGTQKVASLLFVAFVENAFKHGVLNDQANPVTISLKVSNDRLEFTVRNKKNNSRKDKTAGIGLANVKRRLELLYRGKHNLTIIDDDYYTIHLALSFTP